MCNQDNKIQVTGKQTFMGMEIPVIAGGFGEGCKCVKANTVAEIHEARLDKVNELISNNISEFETGVDILDLMDNEESLNLAKGLGFITNNRQKHCYLLSEQGYMLLVGFMKTDKAKQIRKELRRQYFSMRETIHNTYDVVDLAMLKVLKAKNKQEAMIALQEYNELVVQPLQDTIEKQKPMVGLAEMRIDKKGCYSLTDVTKSLHFKRGQITRWAKSQGFIHKTLAEVNNKGEDYFKVYSTDGVHNQIGITENGLEYISQHVDEITGETA